uniref:probable calcium-binding protein CML46 n=1 Tax=Erigeron canadensis TaxID=72917 RepID=UPI001CB9C8A2|nr:probable calcium-binding protein CML46 [Erigeron canadensis]
MEVKPLKRISFSILAIFKIALFEFNKCNFLSKYLHASIRSLAAHLPNSWNKLSTTTISSGLITTKEFLTSEEINMVMVQLGLQQHCCRMGNSSIDILSVFDDAEPTLSEVKVAFNLFDENLDGFIDEFELHKLLCKFGQQEMANFEECRNMIKGFDVNGDGLLDFDEFVRLMETCSF